MIYIEYKSMRRFNFDVQSNLSSFDRIRYLFGKKNHIIFFNRGQKYYYNL